MTTIDTLRTLPALAAGYITEHGWTQGTEEDSSGRVCLTGALRLCSPVPGDSYIAREVLRRRGRAEGWNDEYGRTAGEVVAYLAATEITDEELAGTFGPQWREIVALVRAVSGATQQQIVDLAAARAAARDAARAAAWDAAGDAAGAAAWDAARAAAWAAARDAVWAAAREAIWAVAGAAAARALTTRDLISTTGYTQAHYDLLTGPWRQVMGPLHADDGEVVGMSAPTIHDVDHCGRHSIAPGREHIDEMFARLRAIANYREAMPVSQAFDDITLEMEAVK